MDEEGYQQNIADAFEAMEERRPLTKSHSSINKNEQMCEKPQKTQLIVAEMLYSSPYIISKFN